MRRFFRTSTDPRARSARLLVLCLSLGTVVNCSCEEETFNPGATFSPESLEFGPVSVASEKTIVLRIRSDGQAAYKITAANLSTPDERKFRIEADPVLTEGLRPGSTATVAVTYRPCPDAWNGNALREGFNYDGCSGAPDSGDWLVTDNTRAESRRISISGQPVQPPVVSVLCPSGMQACGVEEPNLIECNGLSFGTVAADDQPCDIVVEVRNTWRRDKPVGDLVVERMEVKVQRLGEGITVDGAEAGFELLTMEGQPLAVDPGRPFLVPIEAGRMQGAQRFKLRFKGERTGLWRGQRPDTGLRLFTSDPDNRIVTAPITAIGSAPEINAYPGSIDFGPVEVNTTRTSTVRISNEGDSVLRISDIRVQSGNPELVVVTSRGGNNPEIQPTPSDAIQVYVRYTPRDSGTDQEILAISSNDPRNPVLRIPIRGGAVPIIDVDPSDTLVFPLTSPPPPSREEELVVSNVGFGDLVITRLNILGPGDDPSHPSVDDFHIVEPAGCTSLPCSPNLTLCPPGGAGCSTSETRIVIRYENNDISTTDLATLVISSNDTSNPEIRVVLSAADEPCLFPTPIITVTTPRPCVGEEVHVNATSSNGGGPIGSPATLTGYAWSWGFAPGPMPWPAITPADGESGVFVPTTSGVHFLSLHVTNSCGSRSQAAAREMINVAAVCGN